MENKIGRRLKNAEQVHHIDGNQYNNAIENLQILSASEHTSLHKKGKITSILEAYKKLK